MKKPRSADTPPSSIDWQELEESLHLQRKQELGFVDLAEVDGFTYPTFFTAKFDYFATGEGMTIGIVMSYAQSATALRAMVNDQFNTYYAQGAEIWPRLQIPFGSAGSLVPDAVRMLIADPPKKIGHFHFACSFHRNLS